MADKKIDGCGHLSLRSPGATKRSYTQTDSSSTDNGLISSPNSHDHDDSFGSNKRFKSYRDHNIESQDTDTQVYSESLDSQNWCNASSSNLSLSPSTSRNAGLGSLDLSSMIERYDNATLNSLSMSQMSYMSEDAVGSPFPQTVDMTTPSVPQNFSGLEVNSFMEKEQDSTMSSLSWSQSTMMSFTENTTANSFPQILEMASLPLASEISSAHMEKISNGSASQGNYPSDSSDTTSFCESSFQRSHKAKDDVTFCSTSSYITTSRNISTKKEFTNTTCQKTVKNKPDYAQRKSEERIRANENATDQREESVSRDNEGQNGGKFHSTLVKNEQYNNSSSDKLIPSSMPEKTISCESNSDLKDNYKTCKKNPGHEKFYSPPDLKVVNLPLDIQHEDTVTFFQCLSKLVVQISVTSTSEKRGKSDSYSSYIGTNRVRNGSGFIASMDKNMMKIKCTKSDCSHGFRNDSTFTEHSVVKSSPTSASVSSPSNASSSVSSNRKSGEKKHLVYGGVHVRTNRHVIFDKSEADDACVNFFFQSSDKKGVVKGQVASILGVNNEQDHIVLHVMSHDKLLLDMIDLHLKNAKSSYHQMIKSTHNTQQFHSLNKLSWVSVISHPHGTASSISFGQLKKEKSEAKRVIKYYDAATCPGSSGGLLVTPTLLHLQWPGAVHSSHCELTKLNVSLDSRSQELDASVIGLINKNILNKEDPIPENQFRL